MVSVLKMHYQPWSCPPQVASLAISCTCGYRDRPRAAHHFLSHRRIENALTRATSHDPITYELGKMTCARSGRGQDDEGSHLCRG
jgi:hypothetical protein